jgi:hypothetical protein
MNLLPKLPLWLDGIILVACCLLSSEFGQWLHRKISAWSPDKRGEQGRIDMEGFIIGSVFGLFAFIVGFTFTIALDRFDTRRLIVSEEANAIETSFDRAEILDDAQRFPLQNALRNYAHTRISPEGPWDAEKQAQLERSRHLREQLWNVTRNSVLPYRDTDLGVSIAESVADVLNVGRRRELAGIAHIPDRVMDALILYLITSSALLGYLTASQPYRLRAASSLLFVLMAMAIVLILDLDRPRGGSILVPQTALETLITQLDKAILPATPGQPVR